MTTPPSRLLACLAASGLLLLIAPSTVTRAQAGCGSASNPIACENAKPGTPPSEWEVGGDPSIQGFATEMSVNQGERIGFKIATAAPSYQIDIYRIGYYGGKGARKVASVTPSVPLPQIQPECLSEPTTGLVDCGTWIESAFWNVPADATSGIYLAKLTRPDTGLGSHIYFVVRADASRSGILFQTSDTTWQAYNNYGGNSLYEGAPVGRAYKVSYNRPFINRTTSPKNQPFYAEYPMVRWLEANGYNVSYSSGIDTDRRASELLEHQVFLSVGHDEYWSGEQRRNVEAARNAGVHLAFVGGNDVYWKTRWEPSIDGSATPHRTLVSYKETHANLKIDPNAAWTGTWRDPRFSPPSDGGQPENALIGTLYTVDCCTHAIKVPAEHGRFRFWRNTAIAALAPGEVATLAPQTLGYEWNEDLDNGFRPAGLFQLSSTTVAVPSRLRDFGTVTAPGVATHSLTLYRHASGALVFSAGTVQWSWGLDPAHDFAIDNATGDLRMQQATLNLMADMGQQPGTPQPGLVPAAESDDTTPPVTTITAPLAESDILPGGAVEIAGTATEADGLVTAVEVSVDGGVTWRRATGRESWTISWTPVGTGPIVIKSRGTDDSGNVETSGGEITVHVTDPQCPCSIWDPATAVPAVINVNDTSELELGVKFRAGMAGFITGLRFYKSTANLGPHVANLWTPTGTLLATATFTNETASGWQEVLFPVPVAVTANGLYVASYHTTRGHYSVTSRYFQTTGVDTPPLHALGGVAANNGVYRYGPTGFPTLTYNSTNYWVDVVFNTTLPPDSTPPTITATTPVPGSTNVSATTTVQVTFSEPISPATLSSSTFELKNDGGAVVPASVSYDAPTRKATLRPLADLNDGATYTVRVRGGTIDPRVKDVAGNALTSDSVWSFTTRPLAGCPCSIWTDASGIPAVVDSGDPAPVELGMKFRSDVDGVITGVRFYKSLANTGPHIGNLWTATGSLLATATFSGETASGWQQVSFPTPVAISANTLYVVSYHTSAGHYAVTNGYFATTGADAPPLHAVATTTNANGVYRYGASGFPTFTHNAGNYWVDVVFTDGAAPPDTTAPTVTSVTPTAGSTGISTASTVTVAFSEAMDPATVDSSSIELSDGTGLVAAAVSYNVASRMAMLIPNVRLADGTTYTVRVRGGATDPRVEDLAGNGLAADVVSTFTTRVAGDCPCTIWDPATAIPAVIDSGDPNPVELGVKFRADVDGTITGLRFYKSSGNTGTHLANLWTATGTLLATATFTNETGSGWQQVNFSSPVAITANTIYVASYHTSSGRYSINGGYFAGGVDTPPLHALGNATSPNGVFRYGPSGFPSSTYNAGNYWVDVVFMAASAVPDTTPPTVTAVTPAAGATAVNPATTVTVTFSEAVDVATVNAATLELRNASAGVVPATVSYNSSTRTAALTPTAALAQNTTYTAVVRGGTTDPRVLDVSGNALAASMTWSFTTAAAVADGCPCTIWPATAVPAVADAGDGNAVELGVKFRADVDGLITGVRFYKSAANTGTHRGNLWTSTGTLLATATFTNETTSGWQQVNFDSPVAVVANTVYVASYHTNAGHYAVSSAYFASAGTDTPPLHALGNGVSANGVFRYGATGFPDGTYNATNYWVDVVFAPAAPPDPQPVTAFVHTTPADFSTGVLGSGGYVGVAGNGELLLAPAIGEEFAGATLPAGWSTSGWGGSPSVAVTGGALAVDGARVSTLALFSAGRSLEFVATFSGAAYQHAGFGVTLENGVWAMFSSGDAQGLYVRSSNGGSATNTVIPGNWFGTPHRFRIDWGASSITYSIDGIQVASHAIVLTAGMRPLASDYAADGSVLRVDWLRLAPYAASTEYLSATLDAGDIVAWESAAWSGHSPPASSVIVSVRYGNSPVPDATWTPFTVVDGPLSASSRYLQYRLQLSSSDAAQTPVVEDITIRFSR